LLAEATPDAFVRGIVDRALTARADVGTIVEVADELVEELLADLRG
jgi:hypothetical protein